MKKRIANIIVMLMLLLFGIAFNYFTYANENKVAISKNDKANLKNQEKYYIKITKDSANTLANYKESLTKLIVTDSQTIELTAYDSSYKIINNFNSIYFNGTSNPFIKIRITGMKPSSDSLQTRSVSYNFKNSLINKDEYISSSFYPDGTGSYLFSIPVSAFYNGTAAIRLKDRRAYDTINVQILKKDNLLLYGDERTTNYNILAGEPDNIFTYVNPRRGKNIVFLKKQFEIVMQPRDQFKNLINDWKKIGIFRQVDPPNDIKDSTNLGYIELKRVDGNDNWLNPDPYPNGKYFIYMKSDFVHDMLDINSLKIGGLIANNGQVIPFSGNIVQVLVVNHIPYIRTSDTVSFIVKDSVGNIVGDTPQNPIRLRTNSDEFTFSWKAAIDTNDSNYTKTNGSNEIIEDKCIVKYVLKFKEYWMVAYIINDTNYRSTCLKLNGSIFKDVMQFVIGKPAKAGDVVTINWYLILEDQTYKYTDPVYINPHIWLTSPSKVIYIFDAGITGVIDKKVLPEEYGLDQNYPNPFNPTTAISYRLPKESKVKLVIYNILGQSIKTLVNVIQEPGYYNITWDGKDDNGVAVSSGIYVYQLMAGDFISSKKMNLLK